jgi:hypothetical protein
MTPKLHHKQIDPEGQATHARRRSATEPEGATEGLKTKLWET